MNLPIIYIITPTYFRLTQEAELTRLGQTFAHLDYIHWILIEDSNEPTQLIDSYITLYSKFLAKLRKNINITRLYVPTPPKYKLAPYDPHWSKPRGVLQRNKGIQWLRDNQNIIDKKGVVYFADDDNTYDLRLFDEMRDTKKVSIWPVGLVGHVIAEKPLLNSEGKVIGWNTNWASHRPLAVDMAGFAINITLLLNTPDAYFNITAPRGFQESFLLEKLISGKIELEPKAKNCTLTLVWHTRTERYLLAKPKKPKAKS